MLLLPAIDLMGGEVVRLKRGLAAEKTVYSSDPVVIAWWGAEIECVSAVARAERLGRLSGPGAVEGFRRLVALRKGWHEVEPSEEVREAARRLLRVHDLRAADSLHLAAAFVAAAWPRAARVLQ